MALPFKARLRLLSLVDNLARQRVLVFFSAAVPTCVAASVLICALFFRRLTDAPSPLREAFDAILSVLDASASNPVYKPCSVCIRMANGNRFDDWKY